MLMIITIPWGLDPSPAPAAQTKGENNERTLACTTFHTRFLTWCAFPDEDEVNPGASAGLV